MRNRYLVLGLAAFIALALAVPALGGPSNPIASSSANALKIAKKAKRKAAAAQSTADSALSAANKAQTTANGANTAAGAAQTTADAAQAAAAAAQTAADAANANANTRFNHITHVAGTASPSNNSDKALVVANCPGDDPATGGGWVTVGGGGERDAQIEYSSTFYADQWVIVANDIGTDGGNWSITPQVFCAGV
jgi:cytoskeletal protein RodZ